MFKLYGDLLWSTTYLFNKKSSFVCIHKGKHAENIIIFIIKPYFLYKSNNATKTRIFYMHCELSFDIACVSRRLPYVCSVVRKHFFHRKFSLENYFVWVQMFSILYPREKKWMNENMIEIICNPKHMWIF